MSLIHASHDSLPYIDQDVSAAEREKIGRIISKERAAQPSHELHPLIPPEPTITLTPLMQAEVERKAADRPLQGGIDLSRYEAPEAPLADEVDSWQATLRKAYASNSYLSGRLQNLSLLDEMGKNAWLIGNSQLEDILRDLEKELARLKEDTDAINKARKAGQEESRGEMVNLEETWKRGVGSILEVQIATEGLQREILERRRQGVR